MFLGLLPLIAGVILGRGLYSLTLYLAVWALWLPRGRDVLLVYSDSPHWKHFIEEEVLPAIHDRAAVLNWSERRRWSGSVSLPSLLLSKFGGRKEFNPVCIQFRLFRVHRAYRFLKPIRKWRKTGERKDLDDLLKRFSADLGLVREPRDL